MNISSILLAAVDNNGASDTSIFQSWNSMSSGTRQFIIIFAALSAVVLIIFCWALFVRLPKRERAAFLGGRKSERGVLLSESEQKSRRTRRRWFGSGKHRKRRRQERPRNPTLAETGGLPPLRADDEPPANSAP